MTAATWFRVSPESARASLAPSSPRAFPEAPERLPEPLYFLTLERSREKANQGLTQGYLANPEGGGASGVLSFAGQRAVGPREPAVSTARGGA